LHKKAIAASPTPPVAVSAADESFTVVVDL